LDPQRNITRMDTSLANENKKSKKEDRDPGKFILLFLRLIIKLQPALRDTDK
jgi:hypothetical protein